MVKIREIEKKFRGDKNASSSNTIGIVQLWYLTFSKDVDLDFK